MGILFIILGILGILGSLYLLMIGGIGVFFDLVIRIFRCDNLPTKEEQRASGTAWSILLGALLLFGASCVSIYHGIFFR